VKQHKTAIIDPKAQIADDVAVGPYSIIGPNVSIDSGSVVGPHVVINGNTTIGKKNKFFQFASIGEEPQDLKYKGESTKLIIGDENTFRECVTVNLGTVDDQGVTKIGSRNLFMAYSHVAHDCIVGNDNILVNSSALAGHIIVEDFTHVGAYCGVHQFCKVGSYSFIAPSCIILKDVPPYVMVTGGPDSTVCGLNVVGLKRANFSDDEIAALRRAYKVIYRQGLRVSEAVEQLSGMVAECSHIQNFVDFLNNSKRGIIR
jgi:UDP-N-acetylglucosamine acyltransferase